MQLPQASSRPGDSFGFLRLVLALLVIFGHCFPLGGFDIEFVSSLTRGQVSPDSLAVKSFFILSGFLLAHALRNHHSLPRFAVRRIFRIMPAFWVCLLVTSFVMVPVLARLLAPFPISYWESLTMGDRNALTFVANNAFLHIQQWKILPLFAENKVPLIINGSLWTLPCEALCYLLLGLSALVGLVKRRRAALLGFALLYLPFVIAIFQPIPRLPGRSALPTILNWSIHPTGHGLLLAFVAGVAAHSVTGGKPFWNRTHFSAALLALLLSFWLGGFALLWPFVLPYLLLSLAYRLPFQSVGKFGDFSYGTYLYAFPIQQCLYTFNVNQAGFVIYFATAAVLSVACGALSWHLVERPAIKFGARFLTSASAWTDYLKAAARSRRRGDVPAEATPL
jgi:peptidoglycan/LPS O-acetylase OafA/YrhL